VEQQLAKVLAAQPGSATWVAQARTLLQAFQLDALEHWLAQGPPPQPSGDSPHAAG
jgi:hypothetical protein